MKQVLWFSRHTMTDEQREALGDVRITQVSGSPANVHVKFKGTINDSPEQEIAPLKTIISDFDIIAVVLPIHLQQQVLGVAGDKPVIFAENQRILVPNPDGPNKEEKVVFKFNGWKRLLKIDVVTEPFQKV